MYSIMQISTALHKSIFVYRMNGNPLSLVTEHRYLETLITNQLLGFLQHNLQGCSRTLKEQSYKQLILPTVKYCSAIWDPHHQNAIHQLEMIQHRAARFVLNRPWRRNNQDSISQMLSLQDRKKTFSPSFTL